MLRFATSPTGDMTIEALRVAIVNYLIAQQRNESFLVRIDDNNKSNLIEGKDTEIMQILEKFALNHTSVFHQSEHLHMHQTLAVKLLEQDKAFVCTCTPEQSTSTIYSGHCEDVDKTEHAKLKESGIPFVIRIKKPKQNSNTYVDEVDAFVILNADGTPSENFACACDDMISGVTSIIRAESQLENTPRQEYIKAQLGFDAQTKYTHLPSILCPDDKNVVKWMIKDGYVPDAIINYLLLLSSPSMKKEIFTLPDAITWFDIENIPKTSMTFDTQKLAFINREHLRRMDDKALSSLFGFADADIGKLAKLYLEDVSTTKELEKKIKSIFSPKGFSGSYKKEMSTLKTLIQDAPMLSSYEEFTSYIMQKSNLKDENFFTPLRLLLTGAEQGPKLSDVYPLIKPYILEIAS